MIISGILISFSPPEEDNNDSRTTGWAIIEGLGVKIPHYLVDTLASLPLGSEISIRCSTQWSKKGSRYVQAIALLEGER